MKPDSSGNLIDRVAAWLRGLFGAGKSATESAARDVRRTTQNAGDTSARTARTTSSNSRARFSSEPPQRSWRLLASGERNWLSR